MARNMRGKKKHSTRKERIVLKTAQDVARNPSEDEEFSYHLSRFLETVAINENVIPFRRKIMFSFERAMTTIIKAMWGNRRVYVFGSQIEGTTTMKLMSDTDYLHRVDMFRLFLDSEIPPLQPHNQQVFLKMSTSGCASQFCVLTILDPSTLAMRFQKLDPTRDPVDIVNFFLKDWTTINGMIPHTIMFHNKNITNQHPVILQQAKIHGPAESIRNIDNVYACYCKSLPKQCKFVFKRPRPGHWPSEKTLKKAKKYGVFIVPQGPPKSTNICTYDYFEYQWRISTNLTERLFMFSLDTVHLKAFVLTKMIKRSYLPQNIKTG
ncbi:hypothetical protein DPMN_047271 [Dreissena polymorpha]|uniref:Uncharacterized protein n=1 Tax=Dreissena polymorpha TaxID=45954 RepID=A0A9D4D8G4_DREPO|nr:hypothetical protein DPMN_047271 [Dreissena polymorpha]